MNHTATAEITIGPLTANEWASFFLPDDDPRNPLPACCAAISEVRDTIAAVLRIGGDPELCSRMMVLKWPTIQNHLGQDIADPGLPTAFLPLRKLYEAYVQGRPDLRPDETETEWDNAKALMLQYPADLVGRYVEQIPDGYATESSEDRMNTVAFLGGKFVAYVYDPAERTELIHRLAEKVGMPYNDVATMIDLLRSRDGLPWQPLAAAPAA